MSILEDIYRNVTEGKVEETAACVEQALKEGVEAKAVLDKGLVPAMDLVGERFGEGEIFIPQVLWAAKAMQGGMDVLAPHFAQDVQARRGTVVIGTIKGDIHDIGKNLVAMMLGANFKVVDLGVDVPPEAFVERAAQEEAQVVALSALLTTTMQGMSQVVALLEERAMPDVKVIIGGAPVSESFCREIGAHAYGVDAMDAVRKVRDLLAN